jgi:hypothetical protein
LRIAYWGIVFDPATAAGTREGNTKKRVNHFLAFIKAVISAIPFVGGPISSLIGDYFPSSEGDKKQRQALAVNEITEHLLPLYNNVGLYVRDYYSRQTKENYRLFNSIKDLLDAFKVCFIKYELSLPKDICEHLLYMENKLSEFYNKTGPIIDHEKQDASKYEKALELNKEFNHDVVVPFESLKGDLRSLLDDVTK